MFILQGGRSSQGFDIAGTSIVFSEGGVLVCLKFLPLIKCSYVLNTMETTEKNKMIGNN
jgi:hypothetical protein